MDKPGKDAQGQESSYDRNKRIWLAMTPEQRDHDRFVVGQIPHGASWEPETTLYWRASKS